MEAITATIGGSLLGGTTFQGTVGVNVLPQRTMADVRVTPTPSKGVPMLTFYISKPSPTRLEIFDARGRLVARVLEGSVLTPGFHDVALGSSSSGRMPSGVYYYRLETDVGSTQGKLVILR